MTNYYRQALTLAQQSDITSALNVLYPYIEENMVAKRLYGLCLYRYGDYEQAYINLKAFDEYEEDAKKAKTQFDVYKEQVVRLAEENKFKQAINAHNRLNGGSVTEKNIEGCLYALRGKTQIAQKCFMQALILDKGNRQAIDFISALNSESFIDRIKGMFKITIK